MLQEAGFLCLFCTAMAEFWGNRRERAELPRISLATYFPAIIDPSVLGCSLWTAEPQNNIPINNELYTQPSHSMSPGDIIAFYSTAVHSMGITLSGGAGAQFLPGPGFGFPSAPFMAAL